MKLCTIISKLFNSKVAKVSARQQTCVPPLTACYNQSYPRPPFSQLQLPSPPRLAPDLPSPLPSLLVFPGNALFFVSFAAAPNEKHKLFCQAPSPILCFWVPHEA